MSTIDYEWKANFEKRFDLCFRCVYAYVLRRTQDHAIAQHVTRDALVRSLPELVEGDERELAAALLRATHWSLRSETSASGELAHRSESLPPTSAARPPTVTRSWLRLSQRRKASEPKGT
jgi:hypothetical protein